MKYEFKGTPGKWYLQEFTDTYTNIVRSDNGKGQEKLMVLYTPQGGEKEARYNAKIASKAPEMFEFIKKYYRYLNLKDQKLAEQLLKEATEL